MADPAATKRRRGLIPSILMATALAAPAGEPLLTDDPGTPGAKTWELNVAVLLADLDNESAWETPFVSLAYGIGANLELGVGLQYIVLDPSDEPTTSGFGNGSVGGKWRFLDEETHGVSVSIAPAVTFNTFERSVDRGIVDDGTTVRLPVEIGKTIGPVDVYAEVGHEFVEAAEDFWIYGVAAEWPWHERWTVLGEIHGVATQDFDDHELLFNAGLRFAIRDELFLHSAAGLPLKEWETDPTRFIWFLGIQWTF